MQEEKRKQQIILFILGIIPVIWLSLIIAPNIDGGLIDIIKKLTKALDNPFQIIYYNLSTHRSDGSLLQVLQ